jgi:hypothetical protein
MGNAIVNLVRYPGELDSLLKKEEQRHRELCQRYQAKLVELGRLSQVLKGEIPEEETTEKEVPWLYLYKNNFVDAIKKALKNPER